MPALTYDQFKELVEAKSFLTKITSSANWVHLIGINDALFFVLVLSGKWRKLAVVWGSLWMVSTIIMTGAWTTDTIEHLGIIALLVYYSCSE